ncbi:Aldo/keto reductase [Patellaria atrata CBS 101060]|uniref:Aldo/keto reductase n=1 Tax=Patellaria atrata CBS 101060 TaxID=1346257 RepID=A0A9P4SE34_9PEZI|nr:Aldo/keto reductase [Patellaria atrata CBS 101060]
MTSKLKIDSTLPMPSGYDIPIFGFGVYQTPAAEAEALVSHAFKAGYRHVDTAVGYYNEGPCAKALLASGLPRSALFYTTKVPPREISYEGAKKAIAGTFEKTGLDYIDLYLLHAPYGGKENRLGAWKALVEGVKEGKIRSIGVSNYGDHHLEELEAYIKEQGWGKEGVISVNQVELHPWMARPDIVNWCRERGIVMEAYSPLIRATRNDELVLVKLAEKHGRSVAQVLLRWSLQMGFVPLPKTVNLTRIEENADVFNFELDEEDMKELDTGAYESSGWDPTISKD